MTDLEVGEAGPVFDPRVPVPGERGRGRAERDSPVSPVQGVSRVLGRPHSVARVRHQGHNRRWRRGGCDDVSVMITVVTGLHILEVSLGVLGRGLLVLVAGLGQLGVQSPEPLHVSGVRDPVLSVPGVVHRAGSHGVLHCLPK